MSDIIFDNNQNLLVTVKGTGADAPGFLGVVGMTKGVPTSISKVRMQFSPSCCFGAFSFLGGCFSKHQTEGQ